MKFEEFKYLKTTLYYIHWIISYFFDYSYLAVDESRHCYGRSSEVCCHHSLDATLKSVGMTSVALPTGPH